MHGTGQGVRRCARAGLFALCVLATARAGAADVTIEGRLEVRGGPTDVESVLVDGERSSWTALEKPRAPGRVELRWSVTVDGGGSRAIEIPTCAGRGAITLDGVA